MKSVRVPAGCARKFARCECCCEFGCPQFSILLSSLVISAAAATAAVAKKKEKNPLNLLLAWILQSQAKVALARTKIGEKQFAPCKKGSLWEVAQRVEPNGYNVLVVFEPPIQSRIPPTCARWMCLEGRACARRWSLVLAANERCPIRPAASRAKLERRVKSEERREKNRQCWKKSPVSLCHTHTWNTSYANSVLLSIVLHGCWCQNPLTSSRREESCSSIICVISAIAQVNARIVFITFITFFDPPAIEECVHLNIEEKQRGKNRNLGLKRRARAD